jgi:hypothetical protein
MRVNLLLLQIAQLLAAAALRTVEPLWRGLEGGLQPFERGQDLLAARQPTRGAGWLEQTRRFPASSQQPQACARG